MPSINLTVNLDPALNVAKFNAVFMSMKSALGDLGKDIKPIDADKLGSELKKFETEAESAGTALKGMGDEADRTGEKLGAMGSKGSSAFGSIKEIAGGFLAASGIEFGLGKIVEGVKSAIDAGVEYQASLAELSSITGVSGAALDGLGEKAQGLALKFGGPVTGQIDSFKGVLSRLGPDIAKSPEGLERMANAINTLSAASGDDAAKSMDVLTNSMLQFNVDLQDPVKAAGEMEKMMNTLAAGAKVGAAEIPQVGEAIVVAGSAAQNANISFEETNAAIQLLAAKSGKYGSEAGMAVRNVIGLLQKNSKESMDLTKKLGIPFEELGKTLTTKGLGAAMELLNTGFDKMGTTAEKNAALMTLFGTENAGFASALMKNTGMLADFTQQMTGTNTATEQAAVRQNTLAAGSERFAAMVNVNMIAAFKKIEPIATKALGAIGTGVEYAFKAGKFLLDTLEDAAPILITMGAAYGVYAIAVNAGAIATGVASAATAVWNAVLALNPVAAVALGVIGLIAGVKALSAAFSESAADKLEDTQASIELNKKNQETTEQNIKQEKSNVDLIAKYEQLVKAKKEGKNVDDELRKTRDALNEQYPKTIDLTKSHEENLRAVKTQTGLTNVETSKFTESNRALVTEYEKLLNKATRTKEEEARLTEVKRQLKKEFPGVIEGARGTAEGLGTLKVQAGLVTDNMGKLQAQLAGFKKEAIELSQIQAQQKLQLTRDKALSDLSGFLGAAWSEGTATAKNIIVGYYNSITRTADPQKLQSLIDAYKQQLKDLKTAGKIEKDEYNTGVTALIEMLQQRNAELETYRTKANKIVNEPVQDKTGDDKDAVNDKAAKELKSLADEIKKTKSDIAALESQLTINTIDEGRQRAIAEQQERNRSAKAAIEDEIKKDKALKDVKEDERRQLIEFLNVKMAKTEELGRQAIQKIVSEYAKKEIEENRKKYEKILSDQISENQKTTGLLEASLAGFTGEVLLGKIAEIGNKKIELIKLQGEKEINELISNDEGYRTAYEAYVKTMSDFQAGKATPLQLTFAMGNLDNAKSEFLKTNEFVRATNEKTNRGIADQANATNLSVREANLKQIQNSAIRERELRIFEAEKAYSEQMKAAQGNRDAELEAYADMEAKKVEIAKDYAMRTASVGMQVTLTMVNSLSDAFKNLGVDSGNEAGAQARKNLDDLKQNESEIRAQYQKGAISRKDYVDKLNDIDARRQEELKNLKDSELDFLDTVNKALADSMTAMKDWADKSFSTALADMQKWASSSASLLSDMAETQKAIDKAKNDGAIEDQKEFQKKYDGLKEQQTKADEKAASASAAAYAFVAVSAAASLGKAIAEGKNAGKAFLMMMLDSLQAVANIMSAEILAKALATPASIASFGIEGFALWGALTLAINAGVAIAKASVAKGMAKGGAVEGGRNQLRLLNDAPGSDFEEIVMSAGPAKKSKSDLLKINALDISLDDYVMNYRPDLKRKMLEREIDADIIRTVTRTEIVKETVYREKRENQAIIEELKKQNEFLKKQNEILELNYQLLKKKMSSKSNSGVDLQIGFTDDVHKVVEINKEAEVKRW